MTNAHKRLHGPGNSWRLIPNIDAASSVGFTNTNTTITSKIYPDKLEVQKLKEVLFPEKVVVAEQPKTIEQMIAAAKNRLAVFISSETEWQKANLTAANKQRIWKYQLCRVCAYGKPCTCIGGGL